jgi:hypothetical protein
MISFKNGHIRSSLVFGIEEAAPVFTEMDRHLLIGGFTATSFVHVPQTTILSVTPAGDFGTATLRSWHVGGSASRTLANGAPIAVPQGRYVLAISTPRALGDVMQFGLIVGPPASCRSPDVPGLITCEDALTTAPTAFSVHLTVETLSASRVEANLGWYRWFPGDRGRHVWRVSYYDVRYAIVSPVSQGVIEYQRGVATAIIDASTGKTLGASASPIPTTSQASVVVPGVVGLHAR